MADLDRFRTAQDAGGTYETALAELRGGHKRSHWMWFVFPQVAGLGRSTMAQHYAIGSLQEARDYLADPVLGERLRACCDALLALPDGTSAERVMGGIDAVKLRSSLTLFLRADPDEHRFTAALERYFAGAADPETDARL